MFNIMQIILYKAYYQHKWFDFAQEYLTCDGHENYVCGNVPAKLHRHHHHLVVGLLIDALTLSLSIIIF